MAHSSVFVWASTNVIVQRITEVIARTVAITVAVVRLEDTIISAVGFLIQTKMGPGCKVQSAPSTFALFILRRQAHSSLPLLSHTVVFFAHEVFRTV